MASLLGTSSSLSSLSSPSSTRPPPATNANGSGDPMMPTADPDAGFSHQHSHQHSLHPHHPHHAPPAGPAPAGHVLPSANSSLLDHHAVALDELSMEMPWNLPSLTLSSADSMPVWPGVTGTFDAFNPEEQYLDTLCKDRFLNIKDFFNTYCAGAYSLYGLDIGTVPEFVTRDDLCGDVADMQGINWAKHQSTRADVRRRRRDYEAAHLQPQLKELRQNAYQTPDTENYFSFSRMNMAHRASIPHFQLRNLMTSTSRKEICYADRDRVLRTDSEGAPATVVMDLTKEMTQDGNFQITTLAAAADILIAGGFDGEYALTKLTDSPGVSDSPGTRTTVGRIKDRCSLTKSHITNHIHLFPSRSNYTPQAVLSSNDNRLRILDCLTNTFTHSFDYELPVNCSATSPDGRMRVVVGDFRKTYITNAETGRAFETLATHTDDAFACDWADDGIHVATAAQDSTIVVWDARNWARPLKVLYSELSIPRCLKFSPVGGGPRVLVSAEADDYLNIINAQTFESRQVFDFFGRTAGISMTPDGGDLFIAVSEPAFGGIMQFERSWVGGRKSARSSCSSTMSDWLPDEEIDADARVVTGRQERRRRGLDLGGLDV